MPFGYRDEPESRSPGWYPDAADPAHERWWNGVAWSESRRPRGGGAVTSTARPSAEAIPMAATPAQTMDGLAGQPAPRPPRTATRAARASDVQTARAVPAIVIGLLGLIAGFLGFLWLPLIALILAASSYRAAKRIGVTTGAAGAAIGIAVAGLALVLLVNVFPQLRGELLAVFGVG